MLIAEEDYRIFVDRIYALIMKMKAKCLIIFLWGCLPFVAQAQYSNSWINFSQKYYKIPVAKDGIYRLTYSNLQAAGFPVSTIDPRFLQIFHRGQEQSIYVKGQGDAVFNMSDYIEFYGQKNDGTLDSLLYQPSSVQPHKYYNLYSDTTAYFLTYSFPQRGLRMDSVQLVNVNNLSAETYQYSERLFVFHDQYSAGLTASDLVQATAFDMGEGWTGNALQQGQTIDYTIDSLLNGVASAPNPKIDLLLVGRDYVHHDMQVYVGANSGTLRLLASPSFDGFGTYRVNADLNWSDIGSDGKMIVRIAALSTTTNRYQASASYVKVTFAQNFDWTGVQSKKFQLEVKPSGQSYVSITNSNLRVWDVTDQQNIVHIQPTSSNPFNAIVPATSVAKKMYSASYIIMPQIIPVSFRQINPANANFLIITNRALTQSGGSYSNPVKAYAVYRASTAGGSYDTLVMTIDQLYNQFNYGETSPLAIYSFMKFMSQGNVKYLFLVGKGRDISYSAYQRKPVPTTEYRDLVPSAGYPGGDAAFTANLNGATQYPSVPTGRLPAVSAAEVAAYLDKVKEHEAQPLQPWAKQLLHLSGGGSASTSAEFDYFKQIVDGFKLIAEGQYLGGNVQTESKQILGLTKVDVSPTVNAGVNLVTFFGHSSSYSTEIDIGFVNDPTLNYNNKGKYPVFLINGCNAGTIFANMVTFGENWMLTPNKGSRNFIAGTSFGFADELQRYSGLFYQVGFADSTFIKMGIGDIQKETGRRYLQNHSTNIFSVAQIQQMVLAGDPSIKLFGTSTPDYAIDNGSASLVSFDNKPVTSLTDSFALKIVVKNLGAFKPKPVTIRVIRTFNDNSTKTYDSIFSPVLYIDTLTFRIKKDKVIDGFGNNLFTVIVDPLNVIKELSENNNIGTLSSFIPSMGTINLFPTAFGIVNNTSTQLVFQDANLLGSQRNFLLQVDTTALFNSPFLKKQTVSAKVLAKVPLNLLSKDSIVYYWRTKPAMQTSSDSSNWSTSSFVYINNGPEGWAQTRFPQVNTDALINLEPDLKQQNLFYHQTISHISIKSIGVNSTSAYTDASMNYQGVEYNVAIQGGGRCRNNTINLVAFNKQTAVPYLGLNGYWNDPRACGLQPSVINSFMSTELQTSDGIDLLNYIDKIKLSDSVVLYSIGNPSFSTWSSAALTKLNDLGISNAQITSLTDGEPVIIYARKGAAVGSAKILRTSVAPTTSQDLSASSTITGRSFSGTIKSPLIGPAKKWSSFKTKNTAVESTDHISYTIYGISLGGQETLLQENIASSLDLSFIDATKYPLLKVQANLLDSINLTAAQLKNWFVLYESVAEGLLVYQGSLNQKKLQEGQSITSPFGFVNISSKTFSDSLLVQVNFSNQPKARTQASSFKIKAPAPNDTSKFLVAFNSVGKAGLNDISVFVNPKIQPEQYYENNVIGLYGNVNVIADRTRPTLDVTIDNRYLQNGDFVSPSPQIQVKLHDDNPFLFVTDTTHVNLLLSYPCSSTPCPFKRIAFSRNDVQWAPATTSSDFTIAFHPASLPAGNYTLQVSGSDATGNMSSAQPYQVDFEVANETSIALKSVYPNPSNDIFNFSFELSGNELPSDFSLQLFSNDGRLIQQFGLNDINDFVIGNNTISWSSTKANAINGLMIYKLTVSANGKTVSQSGKLILAK